MFFRGIIPLWVIFRKEVVVVVALLGVGDFGAVAAAAGDGFFHGATFLDGAGAAAPAAAAGPPPPPPVPTRAAAAILAMSLLTVTAPSPSSPPALILLEEALTAMVPLLSAVTLPK